MVKGNILYSVCKVKPFLYPTFFFFLFFFNFLFASYIVFC